jgi:hypothetical protein
LAGLTLNRRAEKLPTIVLETTIRATPQRCFDLARDVSVHCATVAFTQERALPPGVTDGPLKLGDLVIFEARHLGVRQQLRARIVRFEPPHLFADEMIRGAFKSLYHLHEFPTATAPSCATPSLGDPLWAFSGGSPTFSSCAAT